MKKLFFFLFYFLIAASGITQQVPRQLVAANGQTVGFLEFRPPDYGSQLHPLIIYLHGIGERGVGGTGNGTDARSALAVTANELPRTLNAGATMRFIVNCQTSSFVVLSPQLYAGFNNWPVWYVREMLAYAKANLKIDTTRIYLTGISLGGGGTWLAASTPDIAAQLAAIAPVCGTCDWADLCVIARAGLPVWAFHAQDDGVVGVGCTNAAVAALSACSPTLVAIKTIYTTGNHWIWPTVYDTTNRMHTPNLLQWLLAHQRKASVLPLPMPAGLVANAGADQIITGSVATLDASRSSGQPGDWAVSWEITGQPPGGTWNVFPGFDKTGVKKTLQNLTAGMWRFRVTVRDGKGASASDEVVLTVR